MIWVYDIFQNILPFHVNLYIPKHWEFHGFLQNLNLRGSEHYGKSLCFLLLFPSYVHLLFHILEFVWISASPKIFEKPITLECLCFSMFSLTMGIHFLLILEIVWISASFKIVEKHISLECFFFFPIPFPYYENSLFPCSENCMDFCFIRII